MRVAELPVRKKIRLQGYDYSRDGIYFVTLCIQDGQALLWKMPAAGNAVSRPLPLNEFGIVVEEAIQNIPKYYQNVILDHYVVMSNHIHLLLRLTNNQSTSEQPSSGRLIIAPTVSEIVRQLKSYVTKTIGFSCWQRSYHDHIIRDKNEYRTRWQYIEDNPQNWSNDNHDIM